MSDSRAQLSHTFLNRLCEAYRVGNFDGHGASMWGDIDQMRRDVHDALTSHDVVTLGRLLADPAQTKLYFGVDELYDHGAPISLPTIQHYKDIAEHSIRLLAISLGFARWPNPEGGTAYRIGEGPEQQDVETLLGLLPSLDFPNPFPNEIGLETSRGTATIRAVAAIYQAIQIKKFSRGKVLEIGAGMGRTAYYAHRFGEMDYTIVDLPLSLVAQATFLALTLGEDMVGFAGECAPVMLLTPAQFHASNDRWDFAINVDSLPEMDRGHAVAYLERLRRDGALFLSINHEANGFTVPDIASAEWRLTRAPYIMRNGYMEELYDFRRQRLQNWLATFGLA